MVPMVVIYHAYLRLSQSETVVGSLNLGCSNFTHILLNMDISYDNRGKCFGLCVFHYRLGRAVYQIYLGLVFVL